MGAADDIRRARATRLADDPGRVRGAVAPVNGSGEVGDRRDRVGIAERGDLAVENRRREYRHGVAPLCFLPSQVGPIFENGLLPLFQSITPPKKPE